MPVLTVNLCGLSKALLRVSVGAFPERLSYGRKPYLGYGCHHPVAWVYTE